MKKFLKNEGFTLVELIVVIAILGILAAVAVPAYSGYITKAKDATVVTELDAIKTACVTTGAMATPYVEVKYIDVDADAAGGAVIKFGATEATATAGDISKFFTNTINWAGTSYEKGATWNGSAWSIKNS